MKNFHLRWDLFCGINIKILFIEFLQNFFNDLLIIFFLLIFIF